ncbi:MAG: small multi-drug export protein [Candidatus Omnitrophica bacterium]|nr:small multi-drug export protein [Candidatus Omnitrophota bacterium]
MIELIRQWVDKLPAEWLVVFMAALPVSELRGAIPLGLALGFSPQKAFLLSVAGNFIPIVPLLIGFRPLSDALLRFKRWENWINRFYSQTKQRAEIIQKYETLGLLLFVAVPLPMTGAWTGCLAASIFRLRFWYAFLAVTMGMVIAGLIVLTACLVGKEGFKRFPILTLLVLFLLVVVWIVYIFKKEIGRVFTHKEKSGNI